MDDNVSIEIKAYWRNHQVKMFGDDSKYVGSTYFRKGSRLTIYDRAINLALENMTEYEFYNFFKILSTLKRSSNVILSGSIYLKYGAYSEMMSSSSFYRLKKKGIDLGFFLPLESSPWYFILNPRYFVYVYYNNEK